MKFERKYLLALIPLILVGALLYFFREIVSYVILAWVVSMIGAPMVVFLRKYLGKTGAAATTLLFFTLVLGLVLYMFIPPLVNQVRNLAKIDYEEVAETIEEPLHDWENWLIEKGFIVDDQSSKEEVALPVHDKLVYDEVIRVDSLLNNNDSVVATQISINLKIDASDLMMANDAMEQEKVVEEDFFERIKQNVFYYINPSRIQSVFSSFVSTFGNVLIAVFSTLFISFFFLKEQGLFYEMVKAALPNKYEEQSTHAIDDISKLLIRYFTGILLQMTSITIFVSLALSLFGVENALLIAFFAALMNVIPYIGPILGASFGVVITISSSIDVSFYDYVLPQIFKVIAVFGVMQVLDNFLLQPYIFSKSVKAHPLEIFLIVLIGAKIGGITGMILAIPTYTAFRVIGKVFLSEFKVVQRLTQNL